MIANDRPRPVLIDADALFEYPIDREQRLEGHSFMRWYHERWRNSRTHLMADIDVRGATLELFIAAQSSSPVGTIPACDAELAALVRVPLPYWRELNARSIAPLHNWVRCRCGDEVRMMHPVVLQVLLDTLRRVNERDLSKEDRAISTRRERLVKALVELGCIKAVTDDHVLIGRIDMWLVDTCKGNRKRIAYIRALEHARRVGWLGDKANAL